MPKSPSLTLAAALVPSAGEHSKFGCESVRGGHITAGVSIVGQHSLGLHRRQSLYLGRCERGGKGERRKKMIVEGAWILVVAVVVFAAIVTVVLVGSGKLYNPDRSHE
jgi:hypothetical protein